MPLIIPKAFAPFIDKGSNLGFPLFIWSTGYIGTPLGLGEHSRAGWLRSNPREGMHSTTVNVMSEKAPVIHQHVLPSSLLSDRKGKFSVQNDKLYPESKSR